MSWDSIFGTKSKKQRKREILEENKRKGKAAEERFVFEQTLQGNEVTRTGRGSDFKVTKRTLITGRVVSSRLHEVKSSPTAPVSKLQKKGVRKRRVTVTRYDDNPFGFF